MKRTLISAFAVIVFTALLCFTGLLIRSQPARVHIYDISYPVGIR